MERALQFIVAKETFSGSRKFPDSAAPSKVIVAARLVKEGYLTILSSE